MCDIEGKTAREAVSKCGQRASFNWATAILCPVNYQQITDPPMDGFAVANNCEALPRYFSVLAFQNGFEFFEFQSFSVETRSLPGTDWKYEWKSAASFTQSFARSGLRSISP